MDLQSLFPIYLPKARTDDQSKEDYDTQITQNENVLNQNLNILFNGIRDLADAVDHIEVGGGSTETIVQTVVQPGGGSSDGGTSDHKLLTNRDANDQHPITAITGLENTLSKKLDEDEALTNEEIEALLGGN